MTALVWVSGAGSWRRTGDARPAPTARDLAALRFVGEQYAIRADVAAVLLTRLSTVGPERGSRLSRRAVREQWAVGSRPAGREAPPAGSHLDHADPDWAALGGLEFEVWSPALDRLDHHHAAAVVRLHREPIPGQGGWVCERALWRRRGKASWHLADAALPLPVPRRGCSRGSARRGS